MTTTKQLNKLLPLQKLYKDYYPICPEDHKVKLELEILKITSRINYINEVDEYEIEVVFETKQSRLNHLNFEA